MSLGVETAEKEKVIYQYKLLKRVRPRPILLSFYGGVGAVPLPLSLLAGESGAWMWTLGAYFLWPLLYSAIALALFSRENDAELYRTRFQWVFRFPWIGYLPAASVPYRLFRAVTVHAFALGFVAASTLWVWLSPMTAAAVAFVHLWSMLPRLIVLFAMQPHASGGAIIAFHAKEVDLYAS